MWGDPIVSANDNDHREVDDSIVNEFLFKRVRKACVSNFTFQAVKKMRSIFEGPQILQKLVIRSSFNVIPSEEAAKILLPSDTRFSFPVIQNMASKVLTDSFDVSGVKRLTTDWDFFVQLIAGAQSLRYLRFNGYELEFQKLGHLKQLI